MKKWEKKAIETIMNQFDFEKVHKVMTFLKWTWGFDKKTPSIELLKEEAERLMRELCDGRGEDVATGGFWVYRFEKDHILTLMFAIEDWSNE